MSITRQVAYGRRLVKTRAIVESAFLNLRPTRASFHMYINSPDVSKREQRARAKACCKRKACIFLSLLA